MLAPKCSTYNGRPTFANPRYLKKAQSEKPCLYEIPYDTSDLANRFAPNKEETMTLANESRSKLNKDYYLESSNANKNIAISELKKLIEKCKGKSVETQFDKPSVVRQPNAQRIPKPSVLGKPTPFSNSLEMRRYNWTQKPLRTKKIWMPKIRKDDVSTSISPTIDIVSRITNIVQLILFIVNSGCTNHMTGNLNLLCNFVEKFLGTVHFGNDQFALILGYGDLNQGNGNDLLTGNRGSDLYTISLQETTSSTPICFMAKASPTKAWLWHRRFSHLNFDYITLLSKKDIVIGLPNSKGRLNLLHMDLCGPMPVVSINGKKYILVIFDDYSRYTWTLFLRSKDETLEVLKDFLMMIQRNLQAQVISVRTNRGTKLLNKTLHAYFKEEGIEHQTSTPRTPEQNGVVERQNRTLVEAARTMLSASKLPLSFWAEAIATVCYTQNRSIIISNHGKTAYHIINDRKPSIKHLYIFGCICYITRDGENLDKMKEKGDPCVMVGYSTQSKGYRVYNKRTRLIVESIHIKFDEIKEMMSDHNSSDLAPQRQEMSVENVSSGLVPQGQKASDYDNSDPMPPRQNVVPTAEKTDSSQQGLEFLFSPLLEEYYNPAHGHAEDNNNDQAPNASFQEAEFINPFCTRVQEIGESSSRNIDNTDVHSFQPQSHDYRWTRDHPLEQVRGNPTMPVQTRRQLATDPEMCMFALTVSIVEPKNIKEAMADSAWIEAMQDELHQFDRLKVWELVDKPFGKMIIKLKWLWKNKKDEDQTVIRNKARLVKGLCSGTRVGIDFERIIYTVASLEASSDFHCPSSTPSLFQSIFPSDGCENGISYGTILKRRFYLLSRKEFVDPDNIEKVYLLRKALKWIKASSRACLLIIPTSDVQRIY
ncbi:retrovirus-related pol polyprotein from transposon TNT 1-94 [Tanacetum coccineum]